MELKISLCHQGFGVLLNSIDVNNREINITKIINHVSECEMCKTLFNEFYEKINLPLPAKLLINNLLTK